jgi:hypothetical protein
MIMRKKAVSIPAVPAPCKRLTSFRAIKTPSKAICFEPISPVATSTKINTSITGIKAMNTACATSASTAESPEMKNGQENISTDPIPATRMLKLEIHFPEKVFTSRPFLLDSMSTIRAD